MTQKLSVGISIAGLVVCAACALDPAPEPANPQPRPDNSKRYLPPKISVSSSITELRPESFVAFDVAPHLMTMDPPVYPDLANEAGVEGTVLCRVLVGTDGLVKDLVIVQSVPMLDQSAADAAWTAKFKPAKYRGNPVAVWMVIPVEYTLHG